MPQFPEFEGIEVTIPNILPVVPIRDMVVFPHLACPIFIGRHRSISAVDFCMRSNRIILAVAQKDPAIESPSLEDIYSIGTAAIILRTQRLPENANKMKALIQGLSKARILEFTQAEAFLTASIEQIAEQSLPENAVGIEPLLSAVKKKLADLIHCGKEFPIGIEVIENLVDPEKLSFLIAANIALDLARAQEILETGDLIQRLKRVRDSLDEQIRICIPRRDLNAHEE